jgi:hypothetical protein
MNSLPDESRSQRAPVSVPEVWWVPLALGGPQQASYWEDAVAG